MGIVEKKSLRLYTASIRSCTTHYREIRVAQTDTKMIVYQHHLSEKTAPEISDSDAEQAMALSQEVDEFNVSDSEGNWLLL